MFLVCVFSVCRLRAGELYHELHQQQPSALKQEDPRSRQKKVSFVTDGGGESIRLMHIHTHTLS